MKEHWRPSSMKHGLKENLLAAIVATLSLVVVAYCTREAIGLHSTLYITASMGAAAVLMFAVPSSPMASPWAFIAGNTLSAFIGISSIKILGNDIWVAPLAVGLSIAGMSALRCLHPPGGATALLCVMGGPDIHQLGYTFLLYPLGLNIGGTLLFIMLHRHILKQYYSGKKDAGAYLEDYSRKDAAKKARGNPLEPTQVIREDIDNALTSMGQYVDVSPEQLKILIDKAIRLSRVRKLSDLRCVDMMTPTTHTIEYGDSLLNAYHIMEENRLSAVTVTDKSSRVEGILSLDQLLTLVNVGKDSEHINHKPGTNTQQLLDALTPSNTLTTAKPEYVGQLLEKVTVFREEQLLKEVIEHKDGFRQYLPIVDQDGKPVGILDTAQIRNITG